MTNTGRIITVDGIELRLREGAGGPVMVMLHGIGSNMTSFDGLSSALPKDWTLLAWNAPGYGGSHPLDKVAPAAADYADRLAGVVARLDLPPFILAGHSLGTLMAVSFARRHPELVRALVLLACAQGYGETPGQLSAKAQARLDDLARLGAAEFARTRAPRLMFRPEAMPEIRDRAIAAMSQINPQGYAQAVRMLAGGDQKGDAAHARVASLVLAGAEDVITPADQGAGVHAALTRAAPDLPHEYAVVQDAGHIFHQEFPAQTAAHLTAFAARISGVPEVMA